MRLLLLVLLALLAGPVAAQSTKTEFGMIDGAEYRIDVPEKWNRELIVYFHGYSIGDMRYNRERPLYAPLARLAERGYAVVQSGYSRSGWAVEQATRDSERLRRFFVKRNGKPTRTYAVGMSMGGLLTVHAIETQPEVYAGGLSLCGALAPADTMTQHAFAVRAAFDAYFPDVLGPLVPVPAGFRPDQHVEERIASALRSNSRAATALKALQAGSTDDNLPGVIGFLTYLIQELQQRAGGNPFDNRDAAYVGTGDDEALNARVRRYAGEAKAMAYLARWYTPSGKPTRPLLALHTLADPLVPISVPNDYAARTRLGGSSAQFVQQWVAREGHCTMGDDEVVGAFDDLLGWIDGKRPPSGLRH